MRKNPTVVPWFALGAVVVMLGALGFLLIGCTIVYGVGQVSTAYPNYYVCQVTCAKGSFVTGSHVQTIADGSVSASPGGALVGSEAAGSNGTIIGGPGIPSGTNEVWWQVHFDDGLEGWAPQTNLVVTDGTDIVLQKQLDVCAQPQWDQNRPEFTGEPTPSVVTDDCRGPVESRFLELHGQDIPPGTFCKFDALTSLTQFDGSCDLDCTDPSGHCLTMGWDPDPPAPDSLSTAVFQTTSLCNVEGTLDITVGGHKPKNSPTAARGVVVIGGRPCPGGSCQVGVAYRLTIDDIEFDSGTIFASDPKFVDLSLDGTTEPGAISLGSLLGFNLGALPAGAALNTARGRRSSETTPSVLVFRNDLAVGSNGDGGLAVAWGANGSCRLFGDLGGHVVDDNGNTQDVSVVMDLGGTLINQPPHVDTSKTATTVECTSPQGATVTLDGSRSSDPDNNIAFYSWRRGSETGPTVAEASRNAVVTTQQAFGQTTYDLRVADTSFAADHDTVTVTVVDKTAPTISCNAPATITPADVAPLTTAPGTVPQKPQQGLSFKATASDVCSGVSQVAVTGYACSKSSCRVAVSGDTITILDSGGVGDTISWTVSTNDGAGNQTQKTCQVNVINK